MPRQENSRIRSSCFDSDQAHNKSLSMRRHHPLGDAVGIPHGQKIETADKDRDLSNPDAAVSNLIHYASCKHL
jgi:hypothetical protein